MQGKSIPVSVEYAIREAVALLRAYQRHFKSQQVETARALLEMVLAELPDRKGRRVEAGNEVG